MGTMTTSGFRVKPSYGKLVAGGGSQDEAPTPVMDSPVTAATPGICCRSGKDFFLRRGELGRLTRSRRCPGWVRVTDGAGLETAGILGRSQSPLYIAGED